MRHVEKEFDLAVAAGLDLPTHGGGQVLEKVAKVKLVLFEFQLARFDLAQVENVVDQSQHEIGRLVDGDEKVVHFGFHV